MSSHRLQLLSSVPVDCIGAKSGSAFLLIQEHLALQWQQYVLDVSRPDLEALRLGLG